MGHPLICGTRKVPKQHRFILPWVGKAGGQLYPTGNRDLDSLPSGVRLSRCQHGVGYRCCLPGWAHVVDPHQMRTGQDGRGDRRKRAHFPGGRPARPLPW